MQHDARDERATEKQERKTRPRPRKKALDAALCGLFCALLAVAGFIRVPIPLVPVTLQSCAALLSGLLLGKRRGAAACALYCAVGLAGLPVFTQGGGIGYVAVPTFGYILGFILGAYISGAVLSGKEPTMGRIMLAQLAGLGGIYALGVPYIYICVNFISGGSISLWKALLSGLVLCLPGDLLLCIPTGVIARRCIRLRGLQK